jgi:hypothetical protein
MSLFYARFLFSVVLFSVVHGTAISSITQAEWAALNSSISGHLFASVPLAEACFERWNNREVKADADNCAAIQKTYTGAVIQTNNFASYGWVCYPNSLRKENANILETNFGTCMSTTETCALQYSNVSSKRNPITKKCSLGNIPDYYIDVNDVSDVQAGLNFASQKKIPIVVKNSGHDHKGRSSGSGSLAIWMNNYRPELKLVREFIPAGCNEPLGDAIQIGAGIQFKDLYSFARRNNVTLVGGTAPTVR